MSKSMINVYTIIKKYGNKVILDHFDQGFERGCYCIIGPNGSGKSTLLKILAGLDKDFSGKIDFPNGDINKLRTYLPDIPKYYPFIKAFEFIEMVCKIRDIDCAKYIDRFSVPFKLQDVLDLPLRSLSLGQMKRVFCTVSLIDEAPIWILDEPSNGLDMQAREALVSAIHNHTKTGVVILSEHNQQTIKSIGELQFIKLGT